MSVRRVLSADKARSPSEDEKDLASALALTAGETEMDAGLSGSSGSELLVGETKDGQSGGGVTDTSDDVPPPFGYCEPVSPSGTAAAAVEEIDEDADIEVIMAAHTTRSISNTNYLSSSTNHQELTTSPATLPTTGD